MMRSRFDCDEPIARGGNVTLRKAAVFRSWPQYGTTQEKRLPRGTSVVLEKAEPIVDDHGRLDRWWYHVCETGFSFFPYRAILEEEYVSA